MFKQWVRRRRISRLPVDPSEDTPRCPPENEEQKEDNDDDDDGDEGLSGKGPMRSAEAHYEA
jgi:hypothetical protein